MDDNTISERFDDIVQVHYTEKTRILLVNAKTAPPSSFLLDNPHVLPPAEETNVSNVFNSKPQDITSITVVYNKENSALDRVEVHSGKSHPIINCDKIKKLGQST